MGELKAKHGISKRNKRGRENNKRQDQSVMVWVFENSLIPFYPEN